MWNKDYKNISCSKINCLSVMQICTNRHLRKSDFFQLAISFGTRKIWVWKLFLFLLAVVFFSFFNYFTFELNNCNYSIVVQIQCHNPILHLFSLDLLFFITFLRKTVVLRIFKIFNKWISKFLWKKNKNYASESSSH